jgi:hypothetical protein
MKIGRADENLGRHSFGEFDDPRWSGKSDDSSGAKSQAVLFIEVSS